MADSSTITSTLVAAAEAQPVEAPAPELYAPIETLQDNFDPASNTSAYAYNYVPNAALLTENEWACTEYKVDKTKTDWDMKFNPNGTVDMLYYDDKAVKDKYKPIKGYARFDKVLDKGWVSDSTVNAGYMLVVRAQNSTQNAGAVIASSTHLIIEHAVDGAQMKDADQKYTFAAVALASAKLMGYSVCSVKKDK